MSSILLYKTKLNIHLASMRVVLIIRHDSECVRTFLPSHCKTSVSSPSARSRPLLRSRTLLSNQGKAVSFAMDTRCSMPKSARGLRSLYQRVVQTVLVVNLPNSWLPYTAAFTPKELSIGTMCLPSVTILMLEGLRASPLKSTRG